MFRLIEHEVTSPVLTDYHKVPDVVIFIDLHRLLDQNLDLETLIQRLCVRLSLFSGWDVMCARDFPVMSAEHFENMRLCEPKYYEKYRYG